jgi:dinuclear metal center YbgI/SA1388 family protein
MTGATSAVGRDDLVAHLDEILESAEFDDYGPNGLQVEGRPEIERLAAGVSACGELFAEARAGGDDAVLVHHGLFWREAPLPLVGIHRDRVRALLDSGLNLIAYHLPLDAHPELGNNALGARALGLEKLEPFGRHGPRTIGFRGRYPAPLSLEGFVGRCEAAFDQAPLVLGAGPPEIRSVALVSGAAQSLLHEAIAAGVDVFVTGEASEWVTNLAREAGIHYVAAGHHATERLGVRALAGHLAKTFGIVTRFVDIPNPV